MAMINTGDIRLHVQRMPPKSGRPAVATAVLVHGMLTDSLASYYFTLAPAFAKSGIDVVTYDLRGHGRSERPNSGYTLDYNLNDLDALLDRLNVTGPVHLVGNSYGGTVAFSYAVRRPDRVASLSVIESSPATPEWAANLGVGMRQWAARMEKDEAAVLDWITVHRGHHKARQAKRAAQLVQATTIVRDVPASRVLTEDQIRSVRCPALFIYGGESSLVEQSAWLESLLPDYRSIVVPGHEHSVLIEAPRAVGTHVLSLIHEVAKAAALGVSQPGTDAQ
ncbi:alpha/beta hydrolase [Streptomyces sp. NPDC093982]|uniref:alpha/beta fold hydrolase n=1 Tax=Streptomyces sp. NPDC093982 TaxID=3155077 RepID=UPI003443F3B2